MNASPYLYINQLVKTYTQGRVRKQVVFNLQADLTVEGPAVIGLLGANGAGKTTLLELIAGNDTPNSGNILCHGQDIHQVKYAQRRQVVNHHRQPNHTRLFKRSLKPSFLLQPASSHEATIHLFDEPDMGDWYISLLFDKFRALKEKGHLVVFCVHPSSIVDLCLVRDVCDHYIFVQEGSLRQISNFDMLLKDDRVRDYLGPLAEKMSTISTKPDI